MSAEAAEPSGSEQPQLDLAAADAAQSPDSHSAGRL